MPLAVRSSGLLEDSLSHPFAGLYSTFFLPNNDPDPAVREAQLTEVRLVYASVYSKASRSYFQAIDYKIEEEQMAILIQEVAGRRFDDRFYPHISGVAQSFNYYRWPTRSPRTASPTSPWASENMWSKGEDHRFAPPYLRWTCCPREQLAPAWTCSGPARTLLGAPDRSPPRPGGWPGPAGRAPVTRTRIRGGPCGRVHPSQRGSRGRLRGGSRRWARPCPGP